MGRIFKFSAELPEGRQVGYALQNRGGNWYVNFFGPDTVRRKRSLEMEAKTFRKKEDQQAHDRTVHQKAAEVIAREYGALLAHQVVSWDQAVELWKEKWASSGLRDTSFKAYLKDMNLVRSMYPATTGPADIDESMAVAWLEEYTTGTDKRVRNADKVKRRHSPLNVKSRLMSIKSIWGTWFLDKLKIVKGNPFAELKPPKADKPEVKWVNDDQLEAFLGWLDDFYQGWEFPKLFFALKAYTACRLADICGLRSSQVVDGGLFFGADQVKGRKARTVPLPADLGASLRAYAGRVYLWENYPGQLRDILKKKGVPTHRLQVEFAPDRLYQWVLNLFKEYKKASGVHLTSHQFRKRAFTLAYRNKIDSRDASIALACGVQTIHDHYIALDEQQVTNDVFSRLGANILGPAAVPQLFHKSPDSAPETPTEK